MPVEFRRGGAWSGQPPDEASLRVPDPDWLPGPRCHEGTRPDWSGSASHVATVCRFPLRGYGKPTGQSWFDGSKKRTSGLVTGLEMPRGDPTGLVWICLSATWRQCVVNDDLFPAVTTI